MTYFQNCLIQKSVRVTFQPHAGLYLPSCVRSSPQPGTGKEKAEPRWRVAHRPPAGRCCAKDVSRKSSVSSSPPTFPARSLMAMRVLRHFASVYYPAQIKVTATDALAEVVQGRKDALQLLQTGSEKARPGAERRPALDKSSGTSSNLLLHFGT